MLTATPGNPAELSARAIALANPGCTTAAASSPAVLTSGARIAACSCSATPFCKRRAAPTYNNKPPLENTEVIFTMHSGQELNRAAAKEACMVSSTPIASFPVVLFITEAGKPLKEVENATEAAVAVAVAVAVAELEEVAVAKAEAEGGAVIEAEKVQAQEQNEVNVGLIEGDIVIEASAERDAVARWDADEDDTGEEETEKAELLDTEAEALEEADTLMDAVGEESALDEVVPVAVLV